MKIVGILFGNLLLASALAFAPTTTLPSRISARAGAAKSAFLMTSAADKNAEMMLKLSLNQMESIKGREGFHGKDADRATSAVKLAAGGKLEEEERRLLGSRRLAKAFSMEKDEKNEKIAFSNMINTLQSLFGRADFRGEEAEKALKELKEVDILATAEDESNKTLLGSKRVYKFVRAATRTLERPVKRKNHPHETYNGQAGHR